jgi:hypothetical protein
MAENSREKRVRNRFSYRQQFTSSLMGGVGGAPEDSSVHGEIINISSGGLGIYSSMELKKGAVLLARIPITGTESSVPALVSVQWVGKNGNDWHAGLKFVIE